MKITSQHEQQLRELLAQLVAIKSPSGEESAIADYCAEWLEARGLEVQRLEHTLLARIPGGSGPKMLFNTHYDTVPANEGWHEDPWRAVWEEGRLVGLGANDAKGCVTTMMFAMQQLSQVEQLAGDVYLALNQEEETNNRGMGLVLAELGAVDLAITGEPTDLEVIRSQSGLGVLIASWHGRSCHAAHVSRVENKNALLEASKELSSLPTPHVLPGEHELLGPSTLTATVMRSGERHNTVPDLAEVTFDARLAAPHDVDECLAILREHLPSAELRVRSRRLCAVETAADHPLVRKALEHSGKAQAIGSNTLSDMALLPGVPAIKCGPGKTVRSHTPNEFLTEEELYGAARFYTGLVPEVLQQLAAPAGAAPEA